MFSAPRPAMRRTAGFFLTACVVAGFQPQSLAAQESAGDPIFDLAGMFELGSLVIDTNGDSVPDFVNATLVLGEAPTSAEIAAATEISARLGFETMAMDLPISRGPEGPGVAIVIGRSGLAATGRSFLGIDPTSLDDGEGAVAAPPLVSSDIIFAAGLEGVVYALERHSGEVIWSFDTAREFTTLLGASTRGGGIAGMAGPMVANGRLFVSSGYG